MVIRILIVKEPAGFLFRNPGLMRVPTEQALRGGESDCRNRTLHQLFLMINFGERAGSGIPIICQGWETDGGHLHLFDSFEPYDQTMLEMSWGRMTGKVFALLTTTPTLTIRELAARLGTSESTIDRTIRKLRQAGKLKRIGSAKGGHCEVLDD